MRSNKAQSNDGPFTEHIVSNWGGAFDLDGTADLHSGQDFLTFAFWIRGDIGTSVGNKSIKLIYDNNGLGTLQQKIVEIVGGGDTIRAEKTHAVATDSDMATSFDANGGVISFTIDGSTLTWNAAPTVDQATLKKFAFGIGGGVVMGLTASTVDNLCVSAK